MTRQENSGIIQQGESNVIGAVSIGAGSEAVNAGGANVGRAPAQDLGAVKELLDDLLQRIDQHAAQLPEPERAMDITRVLRDEIGVEDSDRPTVLRLLERLRAAVETVASLATAVARVTDAIAPWFR